MTASPPIDQSEFKRILSRNVTLPLVVGVMSAAVFVGMIFYLLSIMNWVEHTDQVIANINDATQLTANLESSERGFLITGDESYLAPYEADRTQLANRMVALEEMVSDNPIQVDRFKKIEGQQLGWQKFAQQVIDKRRAGQDFQEMVRAGTGNTIFAQTRQDFISAITMERRLLQERSAASKQATYTVVIVYLVFSLLLAAILAIFGRRDLMSLSRTYNESLQKQVEHSTVLQEQAWLKSGQSQLADNIIGQLAPSMVGEQVLKFLSSYLNMTVAAFYVQEEDGTLQRVASYGFSGGHVKAGQTFQAAEGLVGQVARENHLQLLRDVPPDYLKVVSGLGSGTPRNVVLLPFANEGKVTGVVELGFMRTVDTRDVEFLKLIADNIGNSIGAALYRKRLQDVLTETQQLNEELQVQQEELRTANEELEEQSRVLEISQANLENQKAELEQTNEQLADQAIALDRKNTALNAAQVELERNSEDLRRASRYKSEFLANMSHELRTPLNSSLILAKLLSENKKGNLEDEQVKFAETIYAAGNDLLRLINDILDISKVEAGKLELHPQEIDLRKLQRDIASTFEPLAKQKQLGFKVDIDATAPATITSDPTRLDQIVRNLLSNAIKFTDSGKVELRISGNGNGSISFAVTDTGIGIASEHQSSIFEAFQQADGTISRRFGGTGLGLSISRDLANLLGGSISVRSAEQKGSTFTLTLPEKWNPQTASTPTPVNAIAAAPVPAAVAVAPLPTATPGAVVPAFPDDRHTPSTSNRTILAIEDEPAFAAILFDLAHEMHFRCLVAQSAQEGMEMAAEYLPDAILLDMRLPDRSGLTVLQQLKDNSATRHIPVHVVSGLDRTDAALQLGAIGYASKPLTREELQDVFHKLEEKFLQKIKRVLIVEDDARQRDSIAKLLGDDNIQITAVALGEEALKLLRSTIFDCMIIDLKLPDIQGYDLLQRMTAENLTSFPPVIVYTGRNLTKAEETDLLKYSRSIILKGARSPERLLDEVTLFLHKVESQLPSEAQTMLKTVRSRDRIFEGRKILLVDDDVRNIFALTNALEQKGIKVQIGRDGFEAISKLDDIPDIDLVLMDVMMPGMDGLEATRRIRKDPRFQKLPIITVTAKAMKDDQEQCIAAGATDYLAKPIDLERLYALIRVWMPPLERYAD